MEEIVNGKTYQVVVERKRNRRIYLRVKESGILYVTCPLRCSEREIRNLIRSHEKWIGKQEERLSREQSMRSTGIVENEVSLFGKKYVVKIEKSDEDVMIVEGDTVIYRTTDRSEEHLNTLFYNTAGKKLQDAVNELRSQWDREICEKYGKEYPFITLRYMKTRWGSCTPSNHRIRLSLRLVHYPLVCTDYVLLHEYVHLLVPNHSDAFHSYVSKYMPEWKKYNAFLK